MDISKINRSQHENRNFHIFSINIKAQSEFSHMNSLIPWLIRLVYGLVYDYNLFNDIYIEVLSVL